MHESQTFVSALVSVEVRSELGGALRPSSRRLDDRCNRSRLRPPVGQSSAKSLPALTFTGATPSGRSFRSNSRVEAYVIYLQVEFLVAS